MSREHIKSIVGERRKWYLAGLLSLVVPGLGQAYNDRILKGIILFILIRILFPIFDAFLLVSDLAPFNLFLSVLLIIGGHIYAFIDASVESSRNKYKPIRSIFRKWYIYPITILLVLLVIQPIVGYALKKEVIDTYKITSDSMYPTLFNGDWVIIQKHPYSETEHKRGDIILYHPPTSDRKVYVGRILGLEGEKLEIRDKRVCLDGVTLGEDYVYFQRETVLEEWISSKDNLTLLFIPENEYFILGDNRDESEDSRAWGTISTDRIIGKVKLVYFSADFVNDGIRFNRFGKSFR